MKGYTALKKQKYTNKEYSIVPIRMQDRYLIMQWRNEQIYHLRQDKPLTKEDQDFYFDNVVTKLFEQEQPQQILFSYLENEKFIGYGGLVHINWKDKNAEISFLMDTKLEENYFQFHWTTYLKMLEEVVFSDLNLHKIYVYAFDLRPHLYNVLEKNNYFKDAILKDHCNFMQKYIDVVIYSKINF